MQKIAKKVKLAITSNFSRKGKILRRSSFLDSTAVSPFCVGVMDPSKRKPVVEQPAHLVFKYSTDISPSSRRKLADRLEKPPMVLPALEIGIVVHPTYEIVD